jgi:hypothetical protein
MGSNSMKWSIKPNSYSSHSANAAIPTRSSSMKNVYE